MELPVAARRHAWLHFELTRLTQGAEDDYLLRLRRFYQRMVFSVPVLDFASVGQKYGGNVSARLHDWV